MKVIFLDIDGVLNNREGPYVNKLLGIYPHKVAMLKEIVDATGAVIVVSSSWRHSKTSLQKIFDAFEPFGLEIHDITPKLYVERHREIRSWLDENGADGFAILDDDSDAFIGEMPESSFKCSFEFGLTDAIKREVIEHLNK